MATIAGFECTHILWEITAAAIGYSYDVKPNNEIIVLFIAINDFESDAAIVRLEGRTIEYQCCSYEKLDTYEKNGFSLLKPDLDLDEKIEKSFIKQLEHIMKLVRINNTDIFDIVVIGASQAMPLI